MIIDGHQDLAWNAVALGRDLTAPLAEIRASEGERPAHGEGVATVSLPALRAADVRIALATVFAEPAGQAKGERPGFRTPQEAHRQACDQLDYYEALDAEGEVTIVRDAEGLRAVLAGAAPRPGLALTMEGAGPIRGPRDLEHFAARGVRVIGLAWEATRYAGGARTPGRLTRAGRELLLEMTALGLALDASHLAEKAFWGALRAFPGRVVATHANCRALVPGPRQVSDEMIRAIAHRDGVIGLVSTMLSSGRGGRRRTARPR